MDELIDKHFPVDTEDPKVEVEVEVTPEDDFDPFDPASIRKLVTQAIAEASKVANPPEAAATATPVATEEPVATHTDTAAPTAAPTQPSELDQIRAFKEAHPDVKDLQEHMLPFILDGMHHEAAYWKAKAITAEKARVEAEQRAAAVKAGNAATIRGMSAGSAVSTSQLQKPKPMNIREAYAQVLEEMHGRR